MRVILKVILFMHMENHNTLRREIALPKAEIKPPFSTTKSRVT
jgi:hypothetical protein